MILGRTTLLWLLTLSAGLSVWALIWGVNHAAYVDETVAAAIAKTDDDYLRAERSQGRLLRGEPTYVSVMNGFELARKVGIIESYIPLAATLVITIVLAIICWHQRSEGNFEIASESAESGRSSELGRRS